MLIISLEIMKIIDERETQKSKWRNIQIKTKKNKDYGS